MLYQALVGTGKDPFRMGMDGVVEEAHNHTEEGVHPLGSLNCDMQVAACRTEDKDDSSLVGAYRDHHFHYHSEVLMIH